jgi:hypothetical protein
MNLVPGMSRPNLCNNISFSAIRGTFRFAPRQISAVQSCHVAAPYANAKPLFYQIGNQCFSLILGPIMSGKRAFGLVDKAL